MQAINLIPSLLILHQVKLRGGIQYRVLDRTAETEDKKERSECRTERTIFDKAEFGAGRALRARIENLMRTATGAAASDIGLFAPDTPVTFDAIQTAEREIKSMIDSYHATAFYNRIYSRVITFRVQSDNRQALEAISDQIKDGLENLKGAVKQAEVKEMRASLKALKGFDKLLPDAASAELQELINDMRARARKLNRLINKQGKTLDESEVAALLDAAKIDAAELVIFDSPESEAADAASIAAAELDDFQPVEIPTAPAPDSITEQATPAPDAADFQPVELPAPETETVPIDAAPAPELEPDATPEHNHGDDWTGGDNATDAERDDIRAELLEAYEATDSEKERGDIRKALEALDAATATTV